MQLFFRAHTTINEIISRFQESYPYLRIEFFKGCHENKFPEILCHGLKLSDLDPGWKERMVTIHPVQSVKELESALQKELCLQAKIYRKQKDQWMETCRTFYLSLETQNEMGRLSIME